MGRISFIIDLPDDIQQELEARISAAMPTGRITAWLNETLASRGLEKIPYSTVAYNVKKKRGELQERAREMRETENKAVAIARVFQNAGAPVNMAAVRMLQTELMEAMSAVKIDTEEPLKPADVQALSRALKNLVELERVMQTQYEDSIRRIAERARLVAGDVLQIAKGGGLSDELADQIVERILGVAYIPAGGATPND
jgi:hypothetical protein